MSVNDIIEELAPQLLTHGSEAQKENEQLPENISEDTRKVFALVRERPLQIDEVIESSGFPVPKVSQILLELELLGYLRQLPGNRYTAER